MEEGAQAKEAFLAEELPADQELEAEVGEGGGGEAREPQAPVEDRAHLFQLPVQSVAQDAHEEHHIVADDPVAAGQTELEGRGPEGEGMVGGTSPDG